MIVSHKHKFIFFAVPKTATHAIRTALRQHLGGDDWEQQTLFGKQYLPFPELAALNHGHISADQLRSFLPVATWDAYFKFGFVRNPFDRFVSACFFLNRKTSNFEADARSFMRDALERPRFRARMLIRPQAHFLTDAHGRLAIDQVGRYESLQSSFDHICSRIGIPVQSLAAKNVSQHGTFDHYYDVELREKVAEFYRDDLRLFGYENDVLISKN